MAKIIFGGCGSIAAYKMCDLARLLVKDGHDVHPVLTVNAASLVAPLALSEVCGRKVRLEMFGQRADMEHIELRHDAALLLIAPATANILAKCAAGIADDLLSTTYLSVSCPVLCAPAMNPAMWAHAAVRRNVERLMRDGVHFCGPVAGDVLCGDNGVGKMSDIEEIVKHVRTALG